MKVNKLCQGVHRLFSFVVGGTVGRILYSREYYPKGRWFRHWYSVGWTWMLPDLFGRLFLNRNRGIPWPCSPMSNVTRQVYFHPDDLNNFQGAGQYYQSWDCPIYIGHGTYIAQNVGIITSNHDFSDLNRRGNMGEVRIGESC